MFKGIIIVFSVGLIALTWSPDTTQRKEAFLQTQGFGETYRLVNGIEQAPYPATYRLGLVFPQVTSRQKSTSPQHYVQHTVNRVLSLMFDHNPTPAFSRPSYHLVDTKTGH